MTAFAFTILTKNIYLQPQNLVEQNYQFFHSFQLVKIFESHPFWKDSQRQLKKCTLGQKIAPESLQDSSNSTFSKTTYALTTFTTHAKIYIYCLKTYWNKIISFSALFNKSELLSRILLGGKRVKTLKMHSQPKIPMNPHDSSSITSWYDCIRIVNIYHPR
jgi:hypothetical protein